MRQAVLCFLLAFGCAILVAAPVSSDLAARTASEWMTWQRGQSASAAAVEPWSAEDGAMLWLATFADGGFVLLPGDATAWPILAWDAAAPAPLPLAGPEARYMLESYSLQLAVIIAQQADNTATRAQWDAILLRDFSAWPHMRDVSPLISTAWNQDWPYNADCPADAQGPGGHVYAGCGATTMAQIMKYWAFPATGIGQHSYYLADYGTISADFAAATYNWSSMPNSISSYNAEIAEISFHAGVAADMNYAPDGSGTGSDDVMHALATYFGYSNTLSLVYKEDYTAAVWNSMMREELDAGRPVFYSGYSEDYGHAFVMDGYQGSEYFHFNFGWSGYYNGYFYLSNLNPGGYVFNLDQQAIIGIEPGEGPDDGDPPYNLSAELEDDASVNLHWSMPSGNDALRWDDGINNNQVGLNGAGSWELAVRFEQAQLAPFDGMNLTVVEFFPTEDTDYTIKIWTGGSWNGASGSSGTLVTEQQVTGLVADSWNSVTLTTPVPIDADDELWIGYSTYDEGAGFFPAGCDAGPAVNYYGNLVHFSQWVSLVDQAATLNYNWNIAGFAEDARTGEVRRLSALSASTPAFTAAQPEAAPTNLPVLRARSRNVRSISGFKIYRDNTVLATLNTAGSRDYNDDDVSLGLHEYYVTALYNGSQESDPSNTVEINVTSSEYPGPQNLQYTLSGTSVILAWSAPTGSGGESDEIAYDNGWATGAYAYPGHTLAVRFTADAPGRLMALEYYTSVGSGQSTFNASVFGWNGSTPGEPLYTAEAAAEDGWTRVDVSDAQLFVDGDFAVGFGSVNGSVCLAFDGDLDNGRCQDSRGAAWTRWNETYLVRAVVSYTDAADLPLHPAAPQTPAQPTTLPRLSKSGLDRSRFLAADAQQTAVRGRPAIGYYNVYRNDQLIGQVQPTGTAYIDSDLPYGAYEYYVTALYDDNTESAPSNIVMVDMNGLEDETATGVNILAGNFPNPFNPVTTVRFSLARDGLAQIAVYNVRGQVVRTLVNERLSAGDHDVVWNGTDDHGAPVASGVYFCRMKSAGHTAVRKMVLMK